MGIGSDKRDFPDVLQPEVYRRLWPDLSAMSDEALRLHFAEYGEAEGRQANDIASRSDFVALVPSAAHALEIGPFFSPLLSGFNACFFDVLSQDDLVLRAKSLGKQDPQVPWIRWVSPTGDLKIVDQSFDFVISSHCLEHQPDLVSHLQHVEHILKPEGRYFLLVPDKRYCFDTFLAESSIADVLDAHYAKRRTHLLRSVIEHRALTTHNESSRHWAGEHGDRYLERTARIEASILEYQAASGSYIDVHSWYFTPDSAESILTTLHRLGLINIQIERVYPTRRNSNEFWMILQKCT